MPPTRKPAINVLVVKDAPLAHALLTSFLGADGFQIKSALNAAEAPGHTRLVAARQFITFFGGAARK